MQLTQVARSDESGFTLVELLVVTVILGVVGAITVAGVVRGMQTSAHAQDRVEALTATETTLERISRELRAADPLCAIEPGAVSLIVERDQRLLYHHYEIVQVDDQRWTLQQGRRDVTDDVGDFGDPDNRCEGHDAGDLTPLIDGLASEAVFGPVDHTGSEIAVDPDAAAGDEGSPEDAADRARRVRMIVDRSVQADRPPIQVQTTVMVRNR